MFKVNYRTSLEAAIQAGVPVEPPMGHVYAVFFTDNMVKIGVSREPGKRFRALAAEVATFGHKFHSAAWTQPCTNHRKLERAMHLRFADSRVDREYFRVARAAVRRELMKLELKDESDAIKARSEGSGERMVEFFVKEFSLPPEVRDMDIMERPFPPPIRGKVSDADAFRYWCQERDDPDLKLDRAYDSFIQRGFTPEQAEERMMQLLQKAFAKPRA